MNQRIEGARWAFNFANWSPTREQWVKAAQCIQHEEKERIGQFAYGRDAKASMIGRLLIRKYMVEQVHIPNPMVRLGRTDHGKPFLINEVPVELAPSLSFNVSHQGSYCVLAAEPDRSIGVDVVDTRYDDSKPKDRFFDLMKRQFTADEWSKIYSGSSDTEQFYFFYRHWCLKESYVKALGIGIGFQLQRARFLLKTDGLLRDAVTKDTCLYVDSTLALNWKFEESMLDPFHCVAVAIGSKGPAKRDNLFSLLTFDDLVQNLEAINPPDQEYWAAFCKNTIPFQR